MPMYEKGSVRAEPRSKQQERMKKIMKKFLSSLLALTMILSLVIVPAQAHTTEYSVSGDVTISTVSGSLSLAAGESVTLRANTSGLKLQQSVDSGTATDVEGTVTPSYSWTVTDSGNIVTEDATNNASITLTADDAATTGNVTVKCTVTLTASQDVHADKDSSTITVSVKSKQDAFEDALKTAKVTFNGRQFAIDSSSSPWKSPVKYFSESETSAITDATKYDCTLNGATANYNNGKLTITKGGCSKEITINASAYTVTAPTIGEPNYGVGLSDTRVGQETTLTATYSAASSETVSYAWYVDGNRDANATKATFNCKNLSEGDHNIIVYAYEGGVLAAKSAAKGLNVKKDDYTLSAKSGYSKTMGQNEDQTLSIIVKNGSKDVQYPTFASTEWNSSDTSIAYFPNSSVGKLVAKSKSGSTTVTAKVKYLNKEYPVDFGSISVNAADATIDEITNGKSDYLSDDSLKEIVAKAITNSTTSTVRSTDISKITVSSYPAHVDLYEDDIKSTNKITGYSKDLTDVDYLYFDADDGYIGKDELVLSVKLSEQGSNTITVTLYIPVVGDKDIKDTVTGTSANKSVTFTNSDYDSLYIYTGSNFRTEKYDGDWSKASGHTDWKLVSKNKDYTVSTSAFDKNGKATLYVVAVDGGIASTGTITVSQKSYDINYNVVAGKSVSFSQKDFEDFLENYADDNGDYNSRKDEISFDHAVLTSSIPSAKSEGTLYYGSTEITSSNKSKTDMTDMDKVSFDTVSKPSKDTVSLTFRVYGEIEKPNSKKPDKVNYDVNVVISVVKEDITYTVGIDDTVQLTARDFVNFLQDARTSYRKAELDYVKFDVSGKNVSSYAYGGLYRSYSSYSTGKLADSTDKFYYEPSRTQYDLADVAYHTTRWAEAGKTVYIPFTVYGTKGEEASGTMAITIAQTMNFIDVKASDFFYEPVKWAVNNKITNGTSSTTFSPYKNCNRAEIVTFLWRAAKSPEPTITRNPFSDVQSVRDASYYKAILWASQNGITAGTTATTFSPYQECTRSQIVTFLYRYAKATNTTTYNPFKDVSSVNEASYYNAILWAVGKGITQGTSTTTFSPYASCTRGEAVTFLYRYVNGVK